MHHAKLSRLFRISFRLKILSPYMLRRWQIDNEKLIPLSNSQILLKIPNMGSQLCEMRQLPEILTRYAIGTRFNAPLHLMMAACMQRNFLHCRLDPVPLSRPPTSRALTHTYDIHTYIHTLEYTRSSRALPKSPSALPSPQKSTTSSYSSFVSPPKYWGPLTILLLPDPPEPSRSGGRRRNRRSSILSPTKPPKKAMNFVAKVARAYPFKTCLLYKDKKKKWTLLFYALSSLLKS